MNNVIEQKYWLYFLEKLGFSLILCWDDQRCVGGKWQPNTLSNAGFILIKLATAQPQIRAPNQYQCFQIDFTVVRNFESWCEVYLGATPTSPPHPM